MENFLDFMFGKSNGFTILVVTCLTLFIGVSALHWYFQ